MKPIKRKRAQQRPPSELITVDIGSLSHDGRGIASINGMTTFISGAITGEKISCRITKRHRRYYEGEMAEVLIPSPERTESKCKHFSMCGGCSLQHISIDAQIQLKQKTLLEQLLHFGKVTPEIILPPISGNPWGYRRKARLGVRYVRKKSQLMIGFREKHSNLLTNVIDCPVLHPNVGSRVGELGELIAGLSQYEQIAQIEVAVSDQETALIFRHLVDLPNDDINKLIQFGQANNFHIYLQPNAPAAIQKIWPQNEENNLSYFLPEHKIEMQFRPLDFIQVNSEINHLMLKQALTLLDAKPTEKILDLFCGLGNFTLPIARQALHVTGVEGSEEMVLRASKNAELNAIANVDFHAANLMKPSLTSSWMKQTYDKILLDPPRTGAKEIIESFPNLGAKRIIYVSCNPATLARDAGELVYNQGYKLKQVGVINMFPHTSHIEAIAMFEK